MNRKNAFLLLVAALTLVPAAASASELTRRLTIRYHGQDARKHHHHHVVRHPNLHRPDHHNDGYRRKDHRGR